MNEHFKELLDSTYTKDSLQRKIVLLEAFFISYFFTGDSKGPVKEELKNFLIEENVGEHVRGSILGLSDAFFDSFNQQNVKQQFKAVRTEMQNRPHMTIYVPTLLPPIEVEKLGKWARENISTGLFLDIEVDRKVVGGCAFVWNGVYHDFSIAYFMAKKKSEIASLLK